VICGTSPSIIVDYATLTSGGQNDGRMQDPPQISPPVGDLGPSNGRQPTTTGVLSMPNQTRSNLPLETYIVEAQGGIGSGNTKKEALKDLIRQTQNLNWLSLVGCKLDGINFQDCDLRNTRFNFCNLKGCNFQGCDLRNIDFRDCKLNRANFRGAKMTADCKILLKFHHPSAILDPEMDGNQLLLEF